MAYKYEEMKAHECWVSLCLTGGLTDTAITVCEKCLQSRRPGALYVLAEALTGMKGIMKGNARNCSPAMSR